MIKFPVIMAQFSKSMKLLKFISLPSSTPGHSWLSVEQRKMSLWSITYSEVNL